MSRSPAPVVTPLLAASPLLVAALAATTSPVQATVALPALAQQDAEAEVRALMEHPSIREAFRHIEENDPWTIATLRELTQIPAPPFMEEVRGQRFLELLRESGIDSTWVDEVGNVIGLRRGGGSGTMVFSGTWTPSSPRAPT